MGSHTDPQELTDNTVRVSVVMPCLNEEATVGICVRKAVAAMQTLGLKGEVVVVDNGSTDRSAEVARQAGARVVHQCERGYGSAYLKGIAEAKGGHIIIGDSDNTYDFSEIDRFLNPLRDGYDLVMGSRFKGEIRPGAMPWTHQYIGNPVLTGILNLIFNVGISDAHCGMRSFTREAYKRMQLQTMGMEFASEMVINAAKAGLKIAEVPITYHPRAGQSKLRSLRDGWRHLRFMLLYSPVHLFLVPGFLLWFVGMLILVALLPGPLPIGGHAYDIHFMVLGSSLTLLGFQVINLGIYARTYSLTERFEEHDKVMAFFWRNFNLERGLLAGAMVFMTGFFIDSYILYKWIARGFGPLDEFRTALFAMTLLLLGTQTIFSSFFLSILGIRRKRWR